jgi:hypothetical protein
MPYSKYHGNQLPIPWYVIVKLILVLLSFNSTGPVIVRYRLRDRHLLLRLGIHLRLPLALLGCGGYVRLPLLRCCYLGARVSDAGLRLLLHGRCCTRAISRPWCIGGGLLTGKYMILRILIISAVRINAIWMTHIPRTVIVSFGISVRIILVLVPGIMHVIVKHYYIAIIKIIVTMHGWQIR